MNEKSRKSRLRIALVMTAVGAGLVAIVAGGQQPEDPTTIDTPTATTDERPVFASQYNALEDNGVWQVGKDIQPGTYSVIPDEGWAVAPYWARCADEACSLTGSGGAAGAIIENNVPSGRDVITIEPTDIAVELRDVTLAPLAN